MVDPTPPPPTTTTTITTNVHLGDEEQCAAAEVEEAGSSPQQIPEVLASSPSAQPQQPGQQPELSAAALFQLDQLEQERIRIMEEYELCLSDPYRASPESKYERYNVAVDHENGDRANEIKICSVQRPHMRGLHCAWISFFLAFLIWFAPAPLLKEIQQDLHLTKAQVWTSSITNDIMAICLRIIVGPICDAHGARIPMAVVLIVASIPTAMLGLVNSASGLAIVRLFIGIAGSSFVMAQFWPSRMFSLEISGSANGIVAGWGNLGGAVTQLLMGSILFPTFQNYYGGNGEKAWRVICVIPASLAFTWGCILPFISDDAPLGNYSEMRKRGSMDRIFMTTGLRSGVTFNTWILYIQYACCFGVELVMNNAAVLYFTSEFGLSTEDAAKLGFIYGSLNLFARGMGGIISDHLNLRIGMRGRLWLQLILLFSEGICIFLFAFSRQLHWAIVTMCIFSLFTQAAEGAVFGVVPYITKLYAGSVSGFVGSGGNVGSVVYGLGFRSLPYRDAFIMMGCIVMASSLLNFFIKIPLHAGLISGQDNFTVIQTRERFIRRRRMERQRERQMAWDANRHLDAEETYRPGGNGSAAASDEVQLPPAIINSHIIEDGVSSLGAGELEEGLTNDVEETLPQLETLFDQEDDKVVQEQPFDEHGELRHTTGQNDAQLLQQQDSIIPENKNNDELTATGISDVVEAKARQVGTLSTTTTTCD